MYETHRGETDASEVFREQIALCEDEGGPKQTGANRSKWQMANGGGGLLTKVEKPAKSRNNPGQAESARLGAVANFQGVPNGMQRPRVCIRCGDPSRYVKDPLIRFDRY